MSEQQRQGSQYYFKYNGNNSGSIIQGEGNYQETNTYASEKKNLNQAAQEIQGLLEQLDNSYLTNTYFEKVKVAEEAIKRIESNPKLYQRVLSALKTGGAQAFEQFLNHPAASFVIGALEDWQKSKGT